MLLARPRRRPLCALLLTSMRCGAVRFGGGGGGPRTRPAASSPPPARDGPVVDVPAAPSATVSSALRIMFDPVGRGKQRRTAVESRPPRDPMMYTHAAFVPAIGCAVHTGLYELAVLQSAVLGFSLVYHAGGERPGAVAKVEGALAKALFAYGALQTFGNAPPDVFAVEATLAAATLAAFLVTNLRPETYERWHAVGLHVVPGAWSAVVACRHDSLLALLS